MRRPRSDDVELMGGFAALAFLLWAFGYGWWAGWLLVVGAGSYVVALLEG